MRQEKEQIHRLKRTPVAALALLLAIAGCGGDGGPSDEEVIRGWVEAVSEGEYRRAADYFAPGAIVEQDEEFRLPDRSAAIAFNRSLPCRAELTGVEDDGERTLGTFRLRDGPEGLCGAGEGEGESVQVRFLIEDGRFEEWRQLPESDEPLPEGDPA